MRVSAVQCPLGPRAEVEKDCSKLYAARFDWQEYFPDFVREMKREMILDEKRRQISGNIDEDTVSFSLFFTNVYISLFIF